VLGRLLPSDKVAKLAAQYSARESHAAVQDEWAAMLGDAPRAAEVLA
jgi:hypothetical protein